MPDRPAGANADAEGTSVAFNQFNILRLPSIRLFSSTTDLFEENITSFWTHVIIRHKPTLCPAKSGKYTINVALISRLPNDNVRNV
jgi:DNA modification methylase